jgi:hypothetical protein
LDGANLYFQRTKKPNLRQKKRTKLVSITIYSDELLHLSILIFAIYLQFSVS